MKRFSKVSLVAIVAGAAIAWMPAAGSAASGLSAETRTHLEAAMRGEAYEYLLYHAYAMKARLSGHPDVAKVLDEVADQEGHDHFMREAVALGVINDNVTNLETATQSEMSEQINTYTKYAQEADKAGDKAIAALFLDIANEESQHHNILKKAEDQYRSGSPE